MKIAAVILAAGFGRRMGTDGKLLLVIDGKPMAEHCIKTVCESGLFAQCIVVANRTEMQSIVKKYSAQLVENPLAEQGMGTSVAAGCRAVRDDMDFCMFFTADQPFLTEEMIRTLTETAYRTNQIIVPYVGGAPKSPCIFPKRFFAECKALSGEQGGKGIYRTHMDEVVRVEFVHSRAWEDIDTVEDYNAVIRGGSL